MLRFPFICRFIGLIIFILAGSLHASDLTQSRKFTHSDPEEDFDSFGSAVAVTENYVVVGTQFGGNDKGDDEFWNLHSGAVYVYDTNTGQQLHKLESTSINSLSYTNLGRSVAIGTDVFGNEFIAAASAGRVFVFDPSDGSETFVLDPPDQVLSVAASESWIAVGMPFEDVNASNDGQVLVYDTSGTLVYSLDASDGVKDTRFGQSVAISGNTLVVGAGRLGGTGSAYVFDLSTGTEVRKLVPTDTLTGGSSYGFSVAIDGTTAVVGAPRQIVDGEDRGAVFVFDVTTGNQLHKVVGSLAGGSDEFGWAVDISDGIIVAGCRDDRVGSTVLAGSAYIFNAATGAELNRLVASDGAASDVFGDAVAINGSRVLVGALGDDISYDGQGSAYLYNLSITQSPTDISLSSATANENQSPTTLIGTLSGIDPDSTSLTYSLVSGSGDADNDEFRILEGNVLHFNGAFDFEFKSSYSIRVQVSDPEGNFYSESFTITVLDDRTEDFDGDGLTEADEEDTYGSSDLDTDSDNDGYDDDTEVNLGLSPGDATDAPLWGEKETLTDPEAAPGDQFGRSVSLSAPYVIVGAPFDGDQGSAFVFDSSTRTQLFKLTAFDGASGDRFGNRVATDGNWAVVGSPRDDDDGDRSGSVYVFDLTDGTFHTKLTAPDAGAGHQFGSAVAIEGNTILVGAPGAGLGGQVYVFDLVNLGNPTTLTPDDPEAIRSFGNAVDLSGSTALIGAYQDDVNGTDSGSAYLFDLTSGQQTHKLIPGDGAADDLFGWAVSLSEDYAVVGAYFKNSVAENAGAVYVFDPSSGNQLRTLLPTNSDALDWFGVSVSVEGKRALIGASADGSAYFFDLENGDLLKKINYNGSANDFFGSGVALSESYAVVGAENENEVRFYRLQADADIASSSWQTTNGFDPDEPNDVQTLDSDGDGDPDIWELFQGTDRDGAGDSFGFKQTQADAGTKTLSTQFRRSTLSSATSVVTAVGKWSPDLQNWYYSGETADGVTVTFTENPTDMGDYEIVDVDVSVTSGETPQLFYSLELIPVE